MVAGASPRGAEWELYAAHREHFTRSVMSAAPGDGTGRLCVLGAGKCNDLDLERLASVYRELHLVDLEPSAVASGVAREKGATQAKLFPHAPVDLSVVTSKRASKWRRRAPNESELRTSATTSLQGVLARLPGPFDVTVSACVLTQLGFALTQGFGEHHPLLGALRAAVVQTHLQTLVELTAPGGTALLVSDLASSNHYPLSDLPAQAELGAVMNDVVAKRAFYHVAHPQMIEALLSELAPEQKPAFLPPWLWTGPQARTYLVYGLAIRR